MVFWNCKNNINSEKDTTIEILLELPHFSHNAPISYIIHSEVLSMPQVIKQIAYIRSKLVRCLLSFHNELMRPPSWASKNRETCTGRANGQVNVKTNVVECSGIIAERQNIHVSQLYLPETVDIV